MLLAIQIVHTTIAAWNYYCLLYMIYCHWTGRKSSVLVAAYITIAIEAASILPLKFACPIRLFVDRLYSPYVNDMLLPPSLGRLVMPVGIALFIIAAGIKAGRGLRLLSRR
ncbi:MAG TPA: hypothetical protein PLR60_13065 [Syntrophorhabdaceae bacterium]|nr:hypothetical protein [Syntrophorhabdaceae bacterium]